MKSIFLKSLLLTALLFTYNNAMCEQQNINSVSTLNERVSNKHYVFDLIPVDKKAKNNPDIDRINNIRSAVNKINDDEVHNKMLEILSTKSNRIIDKVNRKNSVNLKYYNKENDALYSRYLLKRIIKKYDSNSNKLTKNDTTMFYDNIGRNLSQDEYNKMNLIIRQLVNIFCEEMDEYKPLTIEILNNFQFCYPECSGLESPLPTTYIFTKTFIMRYIDIAQYSQTVANDTLRNVFNNNVNNFDELLPTLLLLGLTNYTTMPPYNDNHQKVTWKNCIIDYMQDRETAVKEFNEARSFLNLEKLQKICNTIILTINELFQDKIKK